MLGAPHRRDRPAAAAPRPRGLRPHRRAARALGRRARHRRGAHRAAARRLLGLHRRGDAGRHRRRLPRRRRDPALRRPRPRPHLHRPPAQRPRAVRDALPRRGDHAPADREPRRKARLATRRERFSQLSYTGARKLSRMPPRSAVVGFSVEDVYAIAELLRRQKGGAAVVMGALSPRTRNAQVALYQNGDVDHLVATDAIGMGLNLDIDHVAFSGLVKFDGRRHRHLCAERARADRRPRRPLHHGRHLRRHRRGAAARSRGGRGDRAAPLSARSPRLQWRNCRPRLRQPRAPGREPRGAGRPSRPAARPRGRRSRDAEGACAHRRGARPAAERPRHPAALGRLPNPRLPQGDARRARQPLRAALPLPARRRRHPDRLAGAADFAYRSNRWRHRRVVQAAGIYPHLDLCRTAQGLGRRRGPLARGDACGRRPAVGCAAHAADAALRRPPHIGADAAAEAEGEPGGDGH